jgi:predicted  nucleic acid-binding Zn-ribbon protein
MKKLFATLLPLLLICGIAAAAQISDYVTEEEEDLIRDAQGLQARVPLFLKLLDNRMVALELRKVSAKEREQTKKDIAAYEAEMKEIKKLKIEGAEERAKPVNPEVYLRNYTRAELLRGYMQIIDETMDNIDDAHDRNLDVRNHIEALQKAVRDQLPMVKNFVPKNANEESALKATIKHSEQALQDIEGALKLVPKTEKKPANTK